MIGPCRKCGDARFSIIRAIDWDVAAWGRLTPGGQGAAFCAGCGSWLKWPSAGEIVAASDRVLTPDRIPPPVLRWLVARGAEQAPSPKHRGLL